GAVRTAKATSSSGGTSTVSGSTLRSKLGLPAAWLHKPVVRIAGVDRYATSVAIGQEAAPSGTTVALASGDTSHLVDGLVAGPLAVAEQAPLLLTAATSLPQPVADEIDRRHATTAYLVGGTGAIGPEVETALRSHGVTTITRLSGADRWATAQAVAEELGSAAGDQAVVASGDAGHLADALAAGGAAGGSGRPVLLVSRDSVPPA